MADQNSSPSDFQRVYKVAAGLDLHKKVIAACVRKTNDDGTVSEEVRQFETHKKNIRELGDWLLNEGVESVVMESTGIFWQNPYTILTELGLRCIVSNARDIAKPKPGDKTDKKDCRWLAQLAQYDMAPASVVLDRKMLDMRNLSRLRQKCVSMRTMFKNRLVKLFVQAGFNITQIVTDPFGASGFIIILGILQGMAPERIYQAVMLKVGDRLKTSKENFIDALDGFMTEPLRFLLNELLDEVTHCNEKISVYDAKLESLLLEAGYEPELQLLQTIPGVSLISAMILLVELGGDVSVFRNSKAISNWVGAAPGNNESARKRKSGKTTKGNCYLRRILCEIANAAVKTQSYFKVKFRSLIIRCGYKRSLIAIAHKIIRVVYCMLTRMVIYRDNTVDFEEMSAKKNAPRWIRKLREFNLLPSNQAKSQLA
jgi:transposase